MQGEPPFKRKANSLGKETDKQTDPHTFILSYYKSACLSIDVDCSAVQCTLGTPVLSPNFNQVFGPQNKTEMSWFLWTVLPDSKV